jgi:hypothetical protein
MNRTKLIDIVHFDTNAPANAPRTTLWFDQRELENPQATIASLIADPATFGVVHGEYSAVMTRDQGLRLFEYLRKGNYRTDRVETKGKPDAILGLSFGDNPDVNEVLAEKFVGAAVQFPDAEMCPQWELARALRWNSSINKRRIHQIDRDCDRIYITSLEVIDKFKRNFGAEAAPNVLLIAQAWHAPRCLDICTKRQVHVVGGAFVDAFSPNDPQEWVRNWLTWVLKEGTK